MSIIGFAQAAAEDRPEGSEQNQAGKKQACTGARPSVVAFAAKTPRRSARASTHDRSQPGARLSVLGHGQCLHERNSVMQQRRQSRVSQIGNVRHSIIYSSAQQPARVSGFMQPGAPRRSAAGAAAAATDAVAPAPAPRAKRRGALARAAGRHMNTTYAGREAVAHEQAAEAQALALEVTHVNIAQVLLLHIQHAVCVTSMPVLPTRTCKFCAVTSSVIIRARCK